MAVGGIGHRQAAVAPAADDVVFFSRELFQQGDGLFLQGLVAEVTSVGKEKRRHGVDEQEGERTVAEHLRTGHGGGAAEGEVGVPVGRRAHAQQRGDVLLVRQLGECRGGDRLVVVEHGQLRHADKGRVVGAHAGELPEGGVDGAEAELMGEEGVFAAELLVIGLARGGVTIVGGQRLRAQQPRLTEEDGLDLKKVVAVLIDGTEREGARPGIEGIAVDAKAERPCQRAEEGVVPVFVVLLVACHNLSHPPLEAFAEQGREPAVDHQPREVAHRAVARRVVVFVEQGLVAAPDGSGDGQHELGDELAVGAVDGGIALAHHVQDDGVVALVLVVMVEKPVGGLHVELHVARPFGAVDDDLGTREVRTGIGVGKTGIDDLYGLAVDGLEASKRKHLVFPYVVQQLFHGLMKIFGQK